MLVSDVIKAAFEFVGRADVAEAVSDGSYTENDEFSRAAECALHCYNAVEDELARGFFPLVKEEELTAEDGRIYYTSFAGTPVRILAVISDKGQIGYRICPKYIEVKDGTYTVRYTCCPAKKQMDSASDYSGYPVGERLMAYGVAAEYCLICGNFEEIECWENRYKDEIERLRPHERPRDIRARRWV